MTSISAEFYALVNAFLFALHNMFTKKALRYSNPATAVISGPGDSEAVVVDPESRPVPKAVR